MHLMAHIICYPRNLPVWSSWQPYPHMTKRLLLYIPKPSLPSQLSHPWCITIIRWSKSDMHKMYPTRPDSRVYCKWWIHTTDKLLPCQRAVIVYCHPHRISSTCRGCISYHALRYTSISKGHITCCLSLHLLYACLTILSCKKDRVNLFAKIKRLALLSCVNQCHHPSKSPLSRKIKEWVSPLCGSISLSPITVGSTNSFTLLTQYIDHQRMRLTCTPCCLYKGQACVQ